MNPLPRRGLLAAAGAIGAATAARAASFGNPDHPPEGAVNAVNKSNLANPGPQNPVLAGQFPSFTSPPATDINGMPLFWASFNNARPTSPSRRTLPASTCGSMRAASARCTGISRRNGRS